MSVKLFKTTMLTSTYTVYYYCTPEILNISKNAAYDNFRILGHILHMHRF